MSGTFDPATAKPTSETGIYLHRHVHDWRYIGAQRWPVGSWHPVFRCAICMSVIADLDVELDLEPDRAAAGTSERTGR